MINRELLAVSIKSVANKSPCEDNTCENCQILKIILDNNAIEQFIQQEVNNIFQEEDLPNLIANALSAGISIGKRYQELCQKKNIHTSTCE